MTKGYHNTVNKKNVRKTKKQQVKKTKLTYEHKISNFVYGKLRDFIIKNFKEYSYYSGGFNNYIYVDPKTLELSVHLLTANSFPQGNLYCIYTFPTKDNILDSLPPNLFDEYGDVKIDPLDYYYENIFPDYFDEELERVENNFKDFYERKFIFKDDY